MGSATPATRFLLNGVDASNLFNGKSTSQVASARIVNNTGVAGAGQHHRGNPFRVRHRPYLAIGQALPTPAPETDSGISCQHFDVRRAAGIHQRSSYRHEHRIRHQRLFTAALTFIAARIG
jgi:hypothetical protein